MKKKYLLLFLICIISLAYSSCSPVHLDAVSEPMQPPWINRWLHNPVCKPPCWENITPGKTTVQEARATLQKLPNIKLDPYIIPGRVAWNIDGNYFGDLGNQANSDVVSDIDLSDNMKTLTLEEVINAYGPPASIEMGAPMEQWEAASLVYPNYSMTIGMVFDRIGSDGMSIWVSPTSTGIDIRMWDDSGFSSVTNSNNETVSPWKGYTIYTFTFPQ